MIQYSKTIVVNSPAGSGGIFCRELIRNNLKAELVWPRHELLGFQIEDTNICIIRNPYDVLASGIEVGFNDIPKEAKEFYLNDEEAIIDDQLIFHLAQYYRFLNVAKRMDYITPFSFEFLTEQPEKFLKHLSNKFEIKFLDKSVSAEETQSLIKSDSRHSTRAPREKTELRIKLDEIVKNYEPIKHVHKEYLALKDILQSTENML